MLNSHKQLHQIVRQQLNKRTKNKDARPDSSDRAFFCGAKLKKEVRQGGQVVELLSFKKVNVDSQKTVTLEACG